MQINKKWFFLAFFLRKIFRPCIFTYSQDFSKNLLEGSNFFNQSAYPKKSVIKLILALILIFRSSLSAIPNLWVANASNSTISIIDTATNSLIETITKSEGRFNTPAFLAFTPDGKYCYVNNVGDSSISVLQVSDRTLLTKITSVQGNFKSNYLSAITPNGKSLYVTNFASDTVSVLSIPSNTLAKTITQSAGQFNAPYSMAISPNAAFAYIGNINSTAISIIDLSNNTLATLISNPAFISVFWISLSPDGRYAYVANQQDPPSGSVSIVDTSTFAVTTISSAAGAFSNPIFIVLNPDGTRAYVSNSAGSVSVIDTSTQTLIANITDGTFLGTSHIAQTPDGAFLYVLNSGTNSIAIIRTSDNTIAGHINAAAGGLSGPVSIQLEPPSAIIEPPTAFTGIVKKLKLLNKNEYVLKSTWKASISPEVTSYNIYYAGDLVKSISATSLFEFVTCLASKKMAQNYEIAASSSLGISSERIKIEIQ